MRTADVICGHVFPASMAPGRGSLWVGSGGGGNVLWRCFLQVSSLLVSLKLLLVHFLHVFFNSLFFGRPHSVNARSRWLFGRGWFLLMLLHHVLWVSMLVGMLYLRVSRHGVGSHLHVLRAF